jgi:hypothetical protein
MTIPGTSSVILFDILAMRSWGILYQSAVMPSSLVTARTITTRPSSLLSPFTPTHLPSVRTANACQTAP